MSFRARATLSLLADENDALAKRIDPSGFCYAVLQILRNGENYTEADFQALVQRGAEPEPTALATAQQRRRDLLEERPVRLPERRRPPKVDGQVRYQGSDDEAERIAEAERTGSWDGQEAVYGGPEEGYERVRYEADRPVRRTPKQRSPEEVVLTRQQLAALLEQTALRAVQQAADAPAPAETLRPDVPEPPDPDEEEYADDDDDPDAVDVTPDDDPPAATDEEPADDRGRDASGRFAPSSKRSSR